MANFNLLRLLKVLSFGVLLCGLPSTVLAESFAVVDLQEALKQSSAGKQAQEQYESKVKSAQSALDKKKSSFEEAKEAYSKQRASLSAKARAEREEKLLGMEKDLKRSFQDTQEKLRRENIKIVGNLVKDLRKVVDQVGRDASYTFIFEKGSQAVLYADSAKDITGDVVKAFNAR